MKKKEVIFIIIMFAMISCERSKHIDSRDKKFITIDITSNFPKKNMILQDFMDVEYIPLESNDDFVCQGFVEAIGENIILVRNRINDGNIFIFDRNGKGLRRINHLGHGGEEYTNILGIILDEDNREMFVNDNFTKKILVYDLEGNFKRSFRHKEGAMYDEVFNFNKDFIICNDGFYNNDGKANMQSFFIISKQNGNVIREIKVPFEKKKLTSLIMKDEKNDMTYTSTPSSCYPIVPFYDTWILVETSSDTVYQYMSNHNMLPFIVRTPPIQSMDPEIFLFLSILTNRYYFIEIVKKEYDFETHQGFPSTDLVYDKLEKTIFEYTVYNSDYSNKEKVYMKSRPINDKIVTWQALQVDKLMNSYEKGELKGKLKEIAGALNEESNPVIMLVKHKK